MPKPPHRDDITDFDGQRQEMVQHLANAGVRDARVLAAIGRIPREIFVPEAERYAAYYDGPLPIGHGQTISQPYVVAVMTELLRLQGHEQVLEIGAGSGYQTALLSLLAGHVFTVERVPALAAAAQAILAGWGARNVSLRTGDGSLGWPDHAPYAAILLTCAAPQAPQPLLDQLADGGRLVGPLGPRDRQELVVIIRRGDELRHERLGPVMFVPLIGQHGW